MGQKMTTNKHKIPKGQEVTRNRFDFINVIGKGGFGKVWKVIDKKNKTTYALKEMAKVKVIDKKSEKSIKYERELLSRLKHPFIVNMYYAFQDYVNLYLVMDLLTGGDLRYHICRKRRFSEEQTRFFIACIVLGLEYIHSKNVIHRDIKPENLVLDDKGYIRITDFGIAKVGSPKNGKETSGTPGYMAPEVMKAQNHTQAVDYFALGVIGYELMLGKRPYGGRGRKEIKEQMMAKQAIIKIEDVPEGWSEEAVDFINKLLIRKPEKRLGFKGANEVKSHSWLKYYPWKDLLAKTIESPFLPEKRENYDNKYCNSIDKIGADTKERYEQYKSNDNYQSIFINFTYYSILDNSSSSVIKSNSIQKKLTSHNKFNCSNTSIGSLSYNTNNSTNKDSCSSLLQYQKKRCASANIALGNITTVKPNTIKKKNNFSLTNTKKLFAGKVLTPKSKNINNDNSTSYTISHVFLRHIRSASHNEKANQPNSKSKPQSKSNIRRSNSNYGFIAKNIPKSKISSPKGKIIGLEIYQVKNTKGYSTNIPQIIKRKTKSKQLTNSNSVNVLFKNCKSNSNSSNSTTGSYSVGTNNGTVKRNSSHK